MQAARLGDSGLLPNTSLPTPTQAPLPQPTLAAVNISAPSADSRAAPAAAAGAAASLLGGAAAAPTALVTPGLQRAAVTVTASPARVPAPSRGPDGMQAKPSSGESSFSCFMK
jgi:hypothetical protein